MAFTLSEIQQAHQQFTGVDFPKLFKAFKDMGMTYNIVNIQDGTAQHTYINQKMILLLHL
ncbi:putative bacteriophage envelope protein [Staphylococcus aureus]|nr:putative bacteriophage envelope protein [Staphylococcus aureus]